MRSRVPLAFLVCFAAAGVLSSASLKGQTMNVFEIYPDPVGSSTTFASRASDPNPMVDNGNAARELLQEVPGSFFAHIGDFQSGGGLPRAHGFKVFTQDEKGSTPETYSFLFRRERSPGGGIDTTAAGVIFQTGPLPTPPPGPGGPIVAWDVKMTFTTPITLPTRATFYMGVSLAAAPGWSMGIDGQSVHAAAYPPSGPWGDFPRPGAPSHAFKVVGGVASLTSPARCWNVGLLSQAPVLNLGGRAPGNTRQAAPPDNFGGGGLYPDVGGLMAGRFDDLVARTRAYDMRGGFSLLYLSSGRGPGIGVFGVPGTFLLDPLVLVRMGTSPLDANGISKFEMPLGPGPSVFRTSLVGLVLNFQAVAADPTGTRFGITNDCFIRL
jgi:hypothetical protein